MKYKKIHICTTESPEGTEWNHNDWFYELRPENVNSLPIGKLYKRRCDASRAAKKPAKEIIHWYPI